MTESFSIASGRRLALAGLVLWAFGGCPIARAGNEPELSLKGIDPFPKSWGTTYAGTIPSKVLGESRKVDIHLPPSYDKTERKYPVLYFFDGEYYFERAVVAARELASAGHIPECIVAAIETPQRRQDLTPPGMDASHSDGEESKGDKFLRFIALELRPQLEAKLRAGAPSVLVGHSHGAILAAYAAAKWRKDFPFLLALDAPVHLDDGWLAKGLIDSAAQKGNLRLVSLEVKFGWSDAQWSRLTAVAPKEWTLVRRKLKGEDHESMVFGGFLEGLKELFSDYSLAQVRGLRGEAAFAHYVDLEPRYGSEVIPPESVVRRGLMALTALGKGDLARKALRILVAGYGSPEDRAELAAQIDEAEAALRGQETVDQLLASKPPTPAEMAPYLGVWKGLSWIDIENSQKQPLIVTFSIQGGHGAATIENPGAPPEHRTERVEYLRVTKAGIEFGNLNGMFPPGVVVRMGEVKAGTLQGESIFKGVYFKYPPDMKPPRHYFSLQKQPEAAL